MIPATWSPQILAARSGAFSALNSYDLIPTEKIRKFDLNNKLSYTFLSKTLCSGHFLSMHNMRCKFGTYRLIHIPLIVSGFDLGATSRYTRAISSSVLGDCFPQFIGSHEVPGTEFRPSSCKACAYQSSAPSVLEDWPNFWKCLLNKEMVKMQSVCFQ